MATTCDVCNKGTSRGRTISSNVSAAWAKRAPKKNRTFKANVRRATITLAGQAIRLDICTRCLRTLAKTS